MNDEPKDDEKSNDATGEMKMLDLIYERHYVYHHLHWLQSAMCESFLNLHHASQDDLELVENYGTNLETIWSSLSPELQTELVEHVTFMHTNTIHTDIASVTQATGKLKLFSSMSLPKRTRWMDVFFPEVSSNK